MAKTKRKKIHEALYYVLVLVATIFISGALFLTAPLLVLGNLFLLYLILIVLGIALGAFLKGFLHDLDELTHTHHAGLTLIVLLVAFLNFLSLTTSYTVFTEKTLTLAIISAMTFTISFLIPYAYQYYKTHRLN